MVVQWECQTLTWSTLPSALLIVSPGSFNYRSTHRLLELGLAGRTLTLKVRWSTFELVTRATSRAQGFQSVQEMQPVLRALLSGLVDGKRSVRLLGVTVSSLISPDEMRRARQFVMPSLWQEEQV